MIDIEHIKKQKQRIMLIGIFLFMMMISCAQKAPPLSNDSNKPVNSIETEQEVVTVKPAKTQHPDDQTVNQNQEPDHLAKDNALPVTSEQTADVEKASQHSMIPPDQEPNGQKIVMDTTGNPEEQIISNEKPLPAEPAAINEEKTATCSLSVICLTISDHLENFNEEKLELIPEDGVIFKQMEVVFYEGESVFNVLQREMKKNKIHFEFVSTPLFNSAYIEGIQNIYELDCGELSGWMYQVNDWFPDYGVSRYIVQPGDSIEIVYTCDLGRDVGGENVKQEDP